MRKFSTCLFTFVATIFSILFVITSVFALLMVNIEKHVFDPHFYGRALDDQNVYEQVPALVAEMIVTSGSYSPCIENPLACNIENATPELQACLEEALGEEAYLAIGSGKRKPTDAELPLAQPCLDQLGGVGAQQPEPVPPGEGGMPLFLKSLTAKDWDTIITHLLPSNDIKIMTEETLTQVFAYLSGETDTVKISLVKLKERLLGKPGTDAVLQLLHAQPPCTDEQLAKFSESVISGQGATILCNPPEEVIAKMTPMIQAEVGKKTMEIPDEVVIIKPPSNASETGGGGDIGRQFGNDPIYTIHLVRTIMRLSFLLPIGFLLLITLLVVRSVKGWLRWWGIPLLITGLLCAVMGFAALPTFDYFIQTSLTQKIPHYVPLNVINIGFDVGRDLLLSLSSVIELQAAIITLAGFGLILGSIFLKTTPKTAEVDVSPPAPAA